MPSNLAPHIHRLELFPVSAQVVESGGHSEITLARNSLITLAEQYGTPLYIYDQATLDHNLEAYREALAVHYPGPSGITYAGKAYLCLGLAQWVHQRGLSLDCSSAGELYIATRAGLPSGQLVVHGVNKSPADLDAALHQAGTLVVDNLTELERVIALYARQKVSTENPLPHIWLRLRPGTRVQTHAHIQTGQEDSKFGLSSAEFLQAVQHSLDADLPLTGLHFHLGSHFHTPEPVCAALEIALDLLQTCQRSFGWLPGSICVGGGWGVPYHEDDLPYPPIQILASAVAQALVAGCQARHLPLPVLQFEPGRSLIAQAGVAIYRIGAVKHTPRRCYLLLDGGLGDNPRPALYQARYTALPIQDPYREPIGPAWLAGPYCESGDILIQDLPMPDVQPGELVAVPVSGAYQLSMSSSYNGVCRPAVVWLRDSQPHLIQSRQIVSDLGQHDLPLFPE